VSRLLSSLVVLAALGALAAVAGSSQASSHKVKVPRLYGKAGPAYDITLTNYGFERIKRVKAGVYTFVINDTSTAHDFHLVGPGVNKATPVRYLGTKTWAKLRLKRGTYRYFCDPHKKQMHGTFKVV
jgi:plastocyanin